MSNTDTKLRMNEFSFFTYFKGNSALKSKIFCLKQKDLLLMTDLN